MDEEEVTVALALSLWIGKRYKQLRPNCELRDYVAVTEAALDVLKEASEGNDIDEFLQLEEMVK